MDDTLIKIARAARKEMECFARQHSDIGDWKDLSCYCAISSYFLKILAWKFGYRLALVEGYAFPFKYATPRNITTDDINHCWNVHEGKVIDITATQFGSQRKVHIVNVGYNTHYAININHQTGNINIEWIFNKWPGEQSPVGFMDELKKRATRLAGELRHAHVS